MIRQALPVVVVVGLFLVVGSSGKGNDSARALDDATVKEEKQYAKIELKGVLIDWFRDPAIELRHWGGRAYPLDLSQAPKEFQGEGWHKFEGEIVIVKGRLVFPPKPKGAMHVAVESIRLADK